MAKVRIVVKSDNQVVTSGGWKPKSKIGELETIVEEENRKNSKLTHEIETKP